jgi:DNA repair exonuclease SbcCD ATPase subunit
MKFVSIKAKNFLSFKELEYNFKSHPVLIQGENLTEPESQKSNGSGKTTIQCAIEYALLTTTSRKVRDAELVFWGEKEGSVELEIYCAVRKQSLIIERKLPVKGSNKLELWLKKGEEVTPVNFSTVADGNKYILDWVDLSKEDIQNFYIVNKERYTSFFSSPNAKKIELISRFSNSYMINGVDKLVQEDVKKLEEVIREKEINKSAIQGVIDDSKEEIDKLENEDFEEEKEKKIKYKRLEIVEVGNEIIEGIDLRKNLEEKNKEVSKKLESTGKEVGELETKIKELNKVSFEEEYRKIEEKVKTVNTDITNKGKEKRTVKSSIDEISDMMDEINKNIKGAVKCPKCSHEFLVGDPEVDIEEEKMELIGVEKLYNSTKTKLTSINDVIEELNKKVDKINSEKTVISKKEEEHNKKVRGLKRQLRDITEEVDSLNKQISQNKNSIENSVLQEQHLNTKIESLKQQIKEIKSQTGNSERIKELNEKIATKTQELEEVEKAIKEKETELYNTSQWVFNFKKFYGHLANKSLKVIQGYCNKYLGEINSDLQVKWEGFKMKADGTLSEKITPYIMRSGEMKDFWSFSGGERARLDFAMILTIQGIINSSHKYGGVEFISLDEVLEGIDDVGLGNLMKSLKNMDKTILLTTHVTDRNTPGDILLVRKVNGVSTLN